MSLLDELKQLTNDKISYSSVKTNRKINELIQNAKDGNDLGSIIRATSILTRIYPNGFNVISSLVKSRRFLPIPFYAKTLYTVENVLLDGKASQDVLNEYSTLQRTLEVEFHTKVYTDLHMNTFFLDHQKSIKDCNLLLDDCLPSIYDEFYDDIVYASFNNEVNKAFCKWRLDILPEIMFYVLNQTNIDVCLVDELSNCAKKFSGLYLSECKNTNNVGLLRSILKRMYPDNKMDLVYPLLNILGGMHKYTLNEIWDDSSTNVPNSINGVTELHDVLNLFTFLSECIEHSREPFVTQYLLEQSNRVRDIYNKNYHQVILTEDVDNQSNKMTSPSELDDKETNSLFTKFKNILSTKVTMDNFKSCVSDAKNAITRTINHLSIHNISDSVGRQFNKMVAGVIDHIIGPDMNDQYKHGINHLVSSLKNTVNPLKHSARQSVIKKFLQNEHDIIERQIEDDDSKSKKSLELIQDTIEDEADDIDLELN